MTYTHICVGGPLAGKQRTSNAPFFDWPLWPKVFAAPSDKDMPLVLVKVEVVHYREEHFYSPDGSLTVWVPEGQSALRTMELLLESYEASTHATST